MTQIPTVKIKKDSARGWSIINEADFDPEKHQLYEVPDEVDNALTGKTSERVDDLCRDHIDTMSKARVRELLDMHGVEYDGRTKLDGLRELAKRAVFVNL